MNILWRIRCCWWRITDRPALIIECSGQLTDRPQVHVSAAHRFGAQGIYTWDADQKGHACATMYGQGLAKILGVPLFDRRKASDPGWMQQEKP